MAGYSNRGGGISDLASIVDGVTVVVNGDGKLESVGGTPPDGAITMAKLADIATASIIGRTAAGTGVPSAISFSTSGHVLRYSGTTLGPGTLIAASFADNTIAPARITNQAARTVLVNATNGSAPITALAGAGASTVLKDTGTALEFSQLAFTDISGTLASGDYADNTIAVSRIADQAAAGLIGRFSSGAGAAGFLSAAAAATGDCPRKQSDGSIAWEAPPAGGGGSIDGSGASTRLAIWSDADTLTSTADVTYDDGTNIFTVAGRLAVGGTTALINASSAVIGAAGLEVRALSGNLASTYTLTTVQAGYAETVSYNSGNNNAVALVTCGNTNAYGNFLGSSTSEWQLLRAYGTTAGLKMGTSAAAPVEIGAANVKLIELTAAGNVAAGIQGALATNATNGFFYIPTSAGTPTGTPATISGMAPLIVDTTNNKLYFYSSSAWRDAGP